MRSETCAVAGAIGASLLIASCCLGPTLFLAFGVSIAGLAHLASLEPYRPFFIILGGIALSYTAWRSWNPSPEPAANAACDPGICRPVARRSVRGLVLVALLLYGLSIVYPWILERLL